MQYNFLEVLNFKSVKHKELFHVNLIKAVEKEIDEERGYVENKTKFYYGNLQDAIYRAVSNTIEEHVKKPSKTDTDFFTGLNIKITEVLLNAVISYNKITTYYSHNGIPIGPRCYDFDCSKITLNNYEAILKDNNPLVLQLEDALVNTYKQIYELYSVELKEDDFVKIRSSFVTSFKGIKTSGRIDNCKIISLFLKNWRSDDEDLRHKISSKVIKELSKGLNYTSDSYNYYLNQGLLTKQAKNKNKLDLVWMTLRASLLTELIRNITVYNLLEKSLLKEFVCNAKKANGSFQLGVTFPLRFYDVAKED